MARGASRLAVGVLAAVLAALLAVPAMASSNGVVISEFQFRGATGGNDDFVELLNTSTGSIDLSGYALQGCAAASGSPSDRATVPDGVTLEPGDHYLFANSEGYSGSAEPDATYGTGLSDTGGARVADADGNVIDGVGSSDGDTDECREGEGLDLPTSGENYAFERTDGADTDDNVADFQGPQAPDPQNLSGDEVPPPAEPEEPKEIKIHDIQGSGQASPLEGEDVVIEGVVTGVDDEIGADYTRTYPEDAGIFVQEEPAGVDDDPATSEGIFVGYVRDRSAYEPGDVVQVTGTVKEKFGFTMIDEAIDTEPDIVGQAEVPGPETIDPTLAANQDADARDYYESLEGMNVRLATGTANSGGTTKFGELFLTPGTGRERVFRTDETPDLIATDADAGAGDPDNPYNPENPSTTLVKGDLFDRVDNVIGPLAYSFDNYKVMVQPGKMPTVTSGPTEYPYDELSESKDGQVQVASFNVENYFDDIHDPGKDDLGDLSDSPPTTEEYEAKRDRIVDAVDRLLARPDVVAVQEVEKKEILDAVADRLGGYTAYLEEGNDSRGIDVGFLVKDTVKASNVRQLGKDAENPTSATCSDADGRLFDRPPLAADITAGKGKGAVEFTLFSNHFASKGSPDACRGAQAAFVRDQVKDIEDSGGEAIVAGDLNSFEDEVALDTLQDGATTLDNLWDTVPPEERYSYNFSGKLQTLDHVLITDGLSPGVEDFRYAHFDNDYYERADADETGDGQKLSDHDPAVLTLKTKDNEEPPENPSDCTIRGTAKDDILRGTPKRDVICGFGGRDILYGLGGNDILRGGPGRDVLFGGAGSDRLFGGTDRDMLKGGPGRDFFNGGPDRDICDAAKGEKKTNCP